MRLVSNKQIFVLCANPFDHLRLHIQCLCLYFVMKSGKEKKRFTPNGSNSRFDGFHEKLMQTLTRAFHHSLQFSIGN